MRTVRRGEIRNKKAVSAAYSLIGKRVHIMRYLGFIVGVIAAVALTTIQK